MVINYNAGTNTITLDGVNTYDFNDIYNADVAGGWGVVSKQGNNQFVFDCFLIVGDGVVQTTFVDTLKQITFNDVGTTTRVAVLDNSSFRLGTVVDVDKKITCDGCDILDLQPIQNTNMLVGDGNIELYSVSVRTINALSHRLSPDKAWNCFFGDGTYQSGGTTGFKIGDFYNCVLVNARAGFYHWHNSTLYNKIIMNKVGAAFYVTGGSNYNDFYIRNYAYIYLWSGVAGDHSYMDDMDTADVWAVKSYYMESNAYRRYSFDLFIVDKNGDAIDSANVKIWNKNGDLVVNENSGIDGKIPTQKLHWGYYKKTLPIGSDADSVEETPHEIQIKKTGYKTYETSFKVENKIEWNLMLLPFVDEYDISGIKNAFWGC